MTKKQKVRRSISRHVSLLFGNLPDEMVLTILAYGEIKDIQSTRVWQSKKVQQYTQTRSHWEASVQNNFDNMKWIYDFIGNTDLTHNLEEFKTVFNCTGIHKCTL